MMLLKILVAALCATLSSAGLARTPTLHRPCKHFSPHCIRDNFSANSACSRLVPGVAPAKYTVPRITYKTPFFNATYDDFNLEVNGQDRCYVAEYFYNPATDNEVLGVECPGLNFVSERRLVQHRTFKEDLIFNFRINGTYPMIRLTTTLHHGNGLNICRESTFAELAALPIFHIDPKDRRTRNALTSDLSMLHIYESELFASRANMLARTFVNNVICNFFC